MPVPSSGVFQPLQRLEDFRFPRHRRLAFFLFFLDDFLRRIGDEFLVAELGVDALDVGVGFCQLLFKPRAFRRISGPQKKAA